MKQENKDNSDTEINNWKKLLANDLLYRWRVRVKSMLEAEKKLERDSWQRLAAAILPGAIDEYVFKNGAGIDAAIDFTCKVLAAMFDERKKWWGE